MKEALKGIWAAPLLASILIMGFTFVQDADAGSVGRFTSIAIGNDGFPVVSYYDDDNGDLKFVHCTTQDCSTFDNPIRLDTLGLVGLQPSIAIAADGFPIISYYDFFPLNQLKLVHCSSIDCSTFDAPLVLHNPGSGDVGRESSITIGTDSFPVVSYHGTTIGSLLFVHCTSVDCSTFDNPIVLHGVGNLGNQGIQSSITIGSDGLPAISYHGISNTGDRVLTFVHCTSVDCSTIDPRIRLDVGGVVGLEPSIAIATDGFPVISYADLTNLDLKLVHCTSLNCSSFDTPIVLDGVLSQVGRHTSIAIGLDGLPVISYTGSSNLKFVKCTSLDCSTPVSPISLAGNSVQSTSISIGADGFPVISYFDSKELSLKLVHCTSADCTASDSPLTLDFPDADSDGIGDGVDNCPNDANPSQTDTDSDGLGDVCDTDDDNDGVLDAADNCPLTANPAQTDTDGDGVGDACEVVSIFVTLARAGTNSEGAIFIVNPSTGIRTLVSDFGDPNQGPLGNELRGITQDNTGTVFVADEADPFTEDGFLFEVNPITGTRTILSDFANSAQGPTALNPWGLAIDGSGNFIVGDSNSLLLFRVDPVTGLRTVAADFSDPSKGPPAGTPRIVEVDGSGFYIVAATGGTSIPIPGGGIFNPSSIFRVDPSNGNRQLLSDCGRSSQGPLCRSIGGFAFDGLGNILATDSNTGTNFNGAVYRINPTTGVRTTVSDLGDTSQGPTGSSPRGIIVDASGTIFVVDTTRNLLFSVDPGTGMRTIVNSFGLSSEGPTGSSPQYLIITVDLSTLDADNDGILDATDNCPSDANPAQTDTDSDGLGDVCDTDDDNDGVLDATDNCPLAANPAQTDTDSDGLGDVCDTDDDNDGVLDAADNCPLTANPAQTDTDSDGLGDVCDTDDDNDGVLDATDNCPVTANSSQSDKDFDGLGDACDRDLLVSSIKTDEILGYDDFGPLGSFVSSGSGGLDGPGQIIVGPDGNIYVTSLLSTEVLRYDGNSGAFIDVAASNILPRGLTFGPDANSDGVADLYVGENRNVDVFDGNTGQFISNFVTLGSGGLQNLGNLVFGPDGDLYIADLSGRQVLRYDGTTGQFMDVFVPNFSGSPSAIDLKFGPDGNLYVLDFGLGPVFRFDGTTGQFIDKFVDRSGPIFLNFAIEFGPDGNLYVATASKVERYDGTTGIFIDNFVQGGAGLNEARGLAFVPSIVIPDDDGDGIFNGVDEQVNTFSDDFNDLGNGGTTSGSISIRADKVWRIIDRSDDSSTFISEGLTIVAGAGSQSAQVTGTGTCSPTTTLNIPARGGIYTLSCSSVSIQVHKNSVEAITDVDGLEIVANLNEGEGITYDFDENGNLLITNLSGSNIVIQFDGEDLSIDPNETLSLDITPPEITTPGDVTVETENPDGTVVTFEVTATDDVDGLVPVSCTPPSGSQFSVGTTQVTCTASDVQGNTESASFTVTVQGTTEEPSAQEQKQDIIQQLKVLRAGDIDKKADKEFKKAIDHLEKSLDPKNWLDDDTVDPKKGKKVFDEEKKSVKSLSKLLKGEDDKCKGVTSLTVEYLGDVSVTIDVTTKKGDSLVQDPDSSTLINQGDFVTVTNDGEKFPSETIFNVGGKTESIHTSCSKPIGVGDEHGSLEIAELETISDDKKDKFDLPDGTPEILQELVGQLVEIDRALAQNAIDEALLLAGDSDKVDKELDKVSKELLKAEEDLNKGKDDKAINHFKKAWEHAQHAIKHAAK